MVNICSIGEKGRNDLGVENHNREIPTENYNYKHGKVKEVKKQNAGAVQQSFSD